MLRITVEYLPGGRAYNPERLATINVTNVTKLAEVSDYFIEAEGKEEKRKFSIMKHVRAHGWAALLKRVFAELGGLK